NREIVFLPRHGKFHNLSPSNINYRANIYGMKKLGVEWIISVTACGSLKEEIAPLHFVIPDQFVDRTNQARKQTFFDEGIVVHISFAHPVCPYLTKLLYNSAKELNVVVHWGGTYLNMEGPQFSTLAESKLYRQWGMDIIGMTNMVEAKLAREAEICYATLAAVTDYDCWHDSEEKVSVDVILNNLRKNVENAKKILMHVFTNLSEERICECKDALKYAIVTNPKGIPQKIRKKLNIFLKKYIKD
ncbi:MAG: MTAP family purine nucleoside phosphorylase, partial [Candidatus Omnitrophica bacterium]|nr:MTAP family purine nucleoside phosphorylase [Candidatus Omnitrophota bacterium]